MFRESKKVIKSGQTKALKDLTRMTHAEAFLADEKRRSLLLEIQHLMAMEPSDYKSMCLELINTLVNYGQNLPEINQHLDGVVDFALVRVKLALTLFQNFLIKESHALSPEQQLWQYALFSAGLLKGIGKLCVDYQVTLFDAQGHKLKQWNPLLGPLNQAGHYYEYQLQKESEHDLRCRLNILMAKLLMPAAGFIHLVSNPTVLAVWLALLSEDLYAAGTLGAILDRAEALAIQQCLLDHLKTTHAGQSGHYSGFPSTFAVKTPQTLPEKEFAIGLEFLHWLINSLEKGRIMVNKAPLLYVPGGLVMGPELFALFMQEHMNKDRYKNPQAVQRGFLALGLHDVTGAKSEQQNINLTQHASVILPQTVSIHQGKSASQATAFECMGQMNQAYASLKQLNETGSWVKISDPGSFLNLGIK